MFTHDKKLFRPVKIEKANPQYAALLQEQLGGANGELKAAMQYLSQSFRIKDPKIKDLFLDIAAEELGHMEMVAQTIYLLNGEDLEAEKVAAGEIQSQVLFGLNPGLINASGYSWSADYVTVTGDLCADLLSNIASEQRAKVTYEYLYRQIDDKGVKDTIEFLLEKSGDFYFMEMNTRIQVEHPVTEWVTGIDLIKEQIRIAAGEKLSFTQEDIRLNGHAIECRINAENPEKGFRPSPGMITDLHLPGGKGVRIDTAVYTGYTIPPYYDSMIAKLIVWAKDRPEAIRKMQSVLGEVIIEGVDTNINYQYEILSNPDFIDGNVDIDFIENRERQKTGKKSI